MDNNSKTRPSASELNRRLVLWCECIHNDGKTSSAELDALCQTYDAYKREVEYQVRDERRGLLKYETRVNDKDSQTRYTNADASKMVGGARRNASNRVASLVDGFNEVARLVYDVMKESDATRCNIMFPSGYKMMIPDQVI